MIKKNLIFKNLRSPEIKYFYIGSNIGLKIFFFTNIIKNTVLDLEKFF